MTSHTDDEADDLVWAPIRKLIAAGTAIARETITGEGPAVFIDQFPLMHRASEAAQVRLSDSTAFIAYDNIMRSITWHHLHVINHDAPFGEIRARLDELGIRGTVGMTSDNGHRLVSGYFNNETDAMLFKLLLPARIG